MAYPLLSLSRIFHWLIRYPHDFHQQRLLLDIEGSSGSLVTWTVVHLESCGHRSV
jgi:hypothetical protein